jgi:hypothetical protein
MHNYSSFVLAMFIGACCSQGACAMELVGYKKGQKDVEIDISDFWSKAYCKNIREVKNIDLKEMRSVLKKDVYLSSEANTLDHLLYFSTIRKNNPEKTLFTQQQQNKFDTALKIKRWVPRCFCINGIVIALTALIPFTNLAALSQCSNATAIECLSQTSAIMTPVIPSVVGALSVGFLSLYATGISPDRSSRKADKVQDEIGHLSRKYLTIAKYWIDIYFSSPEKANYIADKFDIAVLKKRANSKTCKTSSAGFLINPLEEAWHFIRHNEILETFTEIESYIYNKLNRREIESLKKTLHEKNAELEKLKKKKI